MMVIFDGVWDPSPKLGPQRDPKPGVHNSGWVQSPGKEILSSDEAQNALEPYVTAVIKRFGTRPTDSNLGSVQRTDNPNTSAYGSVELAPEVKDARAAELMTKTFQWARAAEPINR